MSSTNKTTNLELNQFVGTDKPSWLGDYNDDMSKIDAGFKKNEDDIANMNVDLAGVTTRVDNVEQNISDMQTAEGDMNNEIIAMKVNLEIVHHENVLNKEAIEILDGKVTDAVADVAAMGTKVSTVEQTVADADLPTLKAKVEDVEQAVDDVEGQLEVGTDKFYFDKKDGVFGYNTSETRGADTFHPFKTGGDVPTDLKPVLLWENSNLAVAFIAQKIELDLTDYAGVIVEFADDTNVPTLCTRLYAKKTDTYGGEFSAGYGVGSDAWARKIDALDNTGITIHDCTGSNTNVIPWKIYGVKEYVVEPAGGSGVDVRKICVVYGIKGANCWLTIYDEDGTMHILAANSPSVSNDYFEISGINPPYVKANKSGHYKAIGGCPMNETFFDAGDIILQESWNSATGPLVTDTPTIYIYTD